MTKGYSEHDNITKEILNTIQNGDFIKCNDWKKPMKVVGVSENYFVMIQKMFGKIFYSICEKKPVQYGRNNFSAGSFRISPDHWLFGWHAGKYEWDNEEWVKAYLDSFESGESKLSERRAVGIRRIAIKSQTRAVA